MATSPLTVSMCLREAVMGLRYEFGRRGREPRRVPTEGEANVFVHLPLGDACLDDWAERAAPPIRALANEIVEGRWALGLVHPIGENWERYDGIQIAGVRKGDGLMCGLYVVRPAPLLRAYAPGLMAARAHAERRCRLPQVTVIGG